jgi:hypothetical protein
MPGMKLSIGPSRDASTSCVRHYGLGRARRRVHHGRRCAAESSSHAQRRLRVSYRKIAYIYSLVWESSAKICNRMLGVPVVATTMDRAHASQSATAFALPGRSRNAIMLRPLVQRKSMLQSLRDRVGKVHDQASPYVTRVHADACIAMHRGAVHLWRRGVSCDNQPCLFSNRAHGMPRAAQIDTSLFSKGAYSCWSTSRRDDAEPSPVCRPEESCGTAAIT